VNGFLLVLFIIGTVVIVVRILAWGLDAQVMPLSCPRCYEGGDTDLADAPRSWYVVVSNERVRCRHCHTRFKEHPNGSLVEDRDS
jgi:hypothetical protein